MMKEFYKNLILKFKIVEKMIILLGIKNIKLQETILDK